RFGLPLVAVAVAVAIVLQFASACSEESGNSSVSSKPVVAVTPRPATPESPMTSPVAPSTAIIDKGEPELPRVYLDTAYTPSSDSSPSKRAITVDSGGDFQSALNRAKAGDVITLQAGATFTGNFTLPNKPGDGAQWIIIRSSAADDKLPPSGTRITPSYSSVTPKLISPDSDPVIATAKGAHHYRFIGVEFGVAPGKSIYNLISFDTG